LVSPVATLLPKLSALTGVELISCVAVDVSTVTPVPVRPLKTQAFPPTVPNDPVTTSSLFPAPSKLPTATSEPNLCPIKGVASFKVMSGVLVIPDAEP